MESNGQLFASPDIEYAIDRFPLIVSPDTSLVNVIALMEKTRGIGCMISHNQAQFQPDNKTRSSCAIIMQGDELQGIFTERDIVKLTAQGQAFNSVMVTEVMTQPVVTLAKSNLKEIFAALFLFRRYRIRHLPIVV